MEILKNKNDFDEKIKEGPILVDFYAEWCGPCKMMEETVEEIDKEKMPVLKVNTDLFMTLARDYKILSIPAFKVFEKGQIVKEKTGYMTKDEMIKFLEM